MKKEEIDVRVSGDELTASGRKEKEEKVERKDYRRLERAAGMFRRTITLPAEVEPEKVIAFYKDAVLEIRAPKVKGAEPKGRKVDVSLALSAEQAPRGARVVESQRADDVQRASLNHLVPRRAPSVQIVELEGPERQAKDAVDSGSFELAHDTGFEPVAFGS